MESGSCGRTELNNNILLYYTSIYERRKKSLHEKNAFAKNGTYFFFTKKKLKLCASWPFCVVPVDLWIGRTYMIPNQVVMRPFVFLLISFLFLSHTHTLTLVRHKH